MKNLLLLLVPVLAILFFSCDSSNSPSDIKDQLTGEWIVTSEVYNNVEFYIKAYDEKLDLHDMIFIGSYSGNNFSGKHEGFAHISLTLNGKILSVVITTEMEGETMVTNFEARKK